MLCPADRCRKGCGSLFHWHESKKMPGNGGYSAFPAFTIFSYLPVSSVTIAVIILCLVLILVFRAIPGTVLALVLHAILALVGTIIRAVLGCIFAAVFLGTVIIVAVTVFAWHKSFLLNSCPVRFSTCRFRLPAKSRLTVTFLLQVLVWNFAAKVCRIIFTFYASRTYIIFCFPISIHLNKLQAFWNTAFLQNHHFLQTNFHIQKHLHLTSLSLWGSMQMFRKF